MAGSAVFVKTELGKNEVESRSGKLTPRQRRVLIFIDGKNTVENLREMLAADDLTHTLGLLEEDGFIELLGVVDDAGAVKETSAPLPSITAFRPLPDKADPKTLDMARHFMVNTLKTFCGGYSHFNLQGDIFGSDSHEKLRAHFDAWYHAIIQTRDGKRRAEELREQLLKVI
jgi:hypothetical protein